MLGPLFVDGLFSATWYAVTGIHRSWAARFLSFLLLRPTYLTWAGYPTFVTQYRSSQPVNKSFLCTSVATKLGKAISPSYPIPRPDLSEPPFFLFVHQTSRLAHGSRRKDGSRKRGGCSDVG